MSTTLEQIETWRKCNKTSVYFTDGSSLGNPGKVGAAALRLSPLIEIASKLPSPSDSLLESNLQNSKECRMESKAATLRTDTKCGEVKKKVKKEKSDERVVWSKTWSQPRDTNNVAELQAVRLALDDVALYPSRSNICIVSDSTYVAGILQQGWQPKRNVKLMYDLYFLFALLGFTAPCAKCIMCCSLAIKSQWAALEKLGFTINIHWVRAHKKTTLVWNKIADDMAKQAAQAQQ